MLAEVTNGEVSSRIENPTRTPFHRGHAHYASADRAPEIEMKT
jgi:hypothetical protein